MKKESIKKIINCLFVLYCICLFYILFLHRVRVGNQFNLSVFSMEHFQMINIVPFKTIVGLFNKMQASIISTNIFVVNMLANFLMFLPMGMSLPTLFEQSFKNFYHTIIFTIGLVVIIEIVQFITFRGSADIDDVILNTLGCMIGYGIIKITIVRKVLKLDK